MEFLVHHAGELQIAEVVSDEIIIASAEDGLDLLGNLNYQGFDRAILHAKNITPEFFDLKTKLAGEVLQKFTTYRLRVCIIGDFTNTESKRLRDFIFESNKGKHVNFVPSVDAAISALRK